MRLRGLQTALFSILAVFAAGVHPLRAQEKLYLKDGSYQLVKSYEVKGDRVRYYSLERSEWEEVPKSLVDFDATERAKSREKGEDEKEIQKAREIENERIEPAGGPGFQVQPGVSLPADEGVYVFDGTRPLRLVQSAGEVITDKKRRALLLALPAPLLKGQSLVVLQGAKAAVRVSTPQPVFFVQAADGWGAKAELIQIETRKDSRLVERIDSGIGLGKSGEQRETIPVERTQLAPGIFKLKPTEPLKPGEYAVGELLTQNKLNLDLWDFGIDELGKLPPK